MPFARYLKLLFMIFFLGMAVSHAEAQARRKNTADIYEIKAKVEESVAAKYRAAMETRLHPEDFTLSVRLDMIRDRKNQSQAEKKKLAQGMETQFLPGLNGYVSATSIMKIYEEELNKELASKESLESENILEELKYYRITGASVFVGLKRDFDKNYQTQLKKWLEMNIRGEFGEASRAEVSLISKRPEQIVTVPWHERLKDLQWIAIVIIAGLFLILSLMSYQWFRSYLRNSELKYQEKLKHMELDGDKELEQAKRLMLEKKEEKERQLREAKEFADRIQESQSRVIMAFLNSPNQSAAVSSLLTYENGGFKLAALLDACYSPNGKKILGSKLPPSFFKVNIPNNQKLQVEKCFAEYKGIDAKEKLKILDSTFWSLSTIDVLSDYQQNRPFQYLRSMDPRSLESMFKDSRLEEKLVSILHLPAEHQRSVLGFMTEEQKLDLIAASFDKEVFAGQELENINRHIQLKYEQTQGEFETVSGTIDLLQNMSAMEEMKVIAKIRKNKPPVAERIKDAFLSLAFVDQWSEDHIRLFFETAGAHEIGSVIKMVPGSRDLILRNISEMQAIMVEDDLSIDSNWNYSKMDASLNELRDRLKQLQRDNLIDKSSVYGEPVEDDYGLRVA